MVGQAVEERGCHLGVAEDAGLFAEGEIGGDNDRGAFVEATDEMEQKLASGLSEGEIAEFVENDEVHAGQVLGEAPLAPVTGLGLEPVDEVEDIVEPTARAILDKASRDRDGEMGLAGAGSSDQDNVALLGDEATAGEAVDQRLVDRRPVELEVVDVLGERQLGDRQLVLDRAGLFLADLGGEQVADDAPAARAGA